MNRSTPQGQDITLSPSLSPMPASTIDNCSSITTGNCSPIITANGCGAVTINQSNDHHHYHQNTGPIFTVMLETIARLEAKIDELSDLVVSMEKKQKKRKTRQLLQSDSRSLCENMR
jgi:hypothetical protein